MPTSYLNSKNGQAILAVMAVHYLFPILVKYVPGLTPDELLTGLVAIGAILWSYLGHKEDTNAVPPGLKCLENVSATSLLPTLESIPDPRIEELLTLVKSLTSPPAVVTTPAEPTESVNPATTS